MACQYVQIGEPIDVGASAYYAAPMDWSTLIRDLQRTGLTQVEIALRVGLTQPSIADIASGRTREPSGGAALKLDALHRKLCRKLRRRQMA